MKHIDTSMTHTTATTIKHLPTEILSIIDHYLNSNNDRIECTAVCYEWNLLFRKSLYHWVRFTTRSQFEKFFYYHGSSCSQLRVHQTASLIKTLDLYTFGTTLIRSTELVELLKKCPNLYSIRYNGWDKLFHDSSSIQSIHEFMNTLRTSSVSSISTLDLSTLVGYRLLYALHSQLTELTLSIRLSSTLSVAFKQEFELLTGIKTLTLHVLQDSLYGVVSREDVEFIHASCPGLKTLTIYSSNIADQLCFSTSPSPSTPLMQQGHNVTIDISKSSGVFIQPTTHLTAFKITQPFYSLQDQALWIQYISSKYPNLKTLGLENTASTAVVTDNIRKEETNYYSFCWSTLGSSCLSLQYVSFYGFVIPTLHHSKTNQLKPIQYCHGVPITKKSQLLTFWPTQLNNMKTGLVNPNLAMC